MSGLLLLFMAVIAVAAISQLGSVNDRADYAFVKGTAPLGQLGDARTWVAEQRITTRDIFLAGDRAQRRALAAGLTASGAKVDAALAAVKPTLVTAKGRADFASLVRDLATYRAARTALIDRALAGGVSVASLVAENKRSVKPSADRLTLDFANLYASKISVAEQSHQSIASTYHSARTLMLGLLAVALLVGLGVAWWVARQIRRNLGGVVARLGSLRDEDAAELTAGLGRMAAGDLTYAATARTEPIESWTNDEIGDVAQATNAIRAKLAESIDAYNGSRSELGQLVGQVSESAATVSAGSEQMAASSDETGRAVTEIANAVGDVAVGAQRQVETIETLRGVAEEMSQITGRAAESLQTTADAAENARTIAADGSRAIGRATEAMATVRDASQQATVRIRELGAKSEEIGGIVDTITTIAEQTNLLALNAAIEAARAGEQGRGFAVVAEEVRKLAEESQAAAASISSLIGEIQEETGRTIEAVETGATRTNEGVEIVEQAGASFRAIGASVDDVTARVAEVAAAAQQIVASSEAMRTDMVDVASVAEQSSASTEEVSASTQQTSAAAQEISASAQELATTAEKLQTLISRFQLA